MVNMVLGAGFLGIPKAFYDAGLILSVLSTIIACLACDYTKNLVMEVMARAEALTEVSTPCRVNTGWAAWLHTSVSSCTHLRAGN
mgnify:CR=1 FL=1